MSVKLKERPGPDGLPGGWLSRLEALYRGGGLIFFSVLFFLAHAAAGKQAPTVPGTSGPLEGRILSILARYEQDRANWGILARSLEKGDDLVSLNAGRLYMPASNLKLLVAATALDLLGPDFRYSTTVMADGETIASDSLLDGDLVVRGSGDPTISDRFYPSPRTVWSKLAEEVAAAGIRRVTGSLVVDNTMFEPPFLAKGWGWEDLMWYYAAPVSALAFNDNCMDVEVFPASRVGESPEVRVKPAGYRVRLLNRALTVSRRKDSRVIISRNTPGGEIVIKGGIYRRSPGFREHVAVDNPAEFAAWAFADELARLGVRIDGPVRVLEAPLDNPRYLDRSPLILAQHLSVGLNEIVKVILKFSHNFYADQLLFTLGAHLGHKGSFTEGLAVEKLLLRKAGADTRKINLEDGSGLSRLNLVTPETFVRLLAYMDKRPAGEVFRSSLSVAGRDRGMSLMRNTAAEDRVFAKTGFITSVMALSGYALTSDGEKVAFSILGNNWTTISRRRARRLIRDLCVEIAGFRRGGESGGE